MAGLLPIKEFIFKRKWTVMKYIFNRHIFQKCLTSKPIAGNVNQQVWWTNQEMMPRCPLGQGTATLSSIIEINNT